MEASEEERKPREGKIIITSTPLGKNNWAHQMFMESEKQGIKGPLPMVWDEGHNLNPSPEWFDHHKEQIFKEILDSVMNSASFKCSTDLTELLTVGETYYISKDNVATRSKFIGKHRVNGEFIFSFERPMVDGDYTIDLGGVKHALIKENQEFYYLHSGSYVGNAMSWWRNGGGYTCNTREAKKFTREEALSQHRCRSTDIPWLSSHVDERAITVADNQYMDTVNILKP